MASFNATKGMHSVEGGALFTQSPEIVDQIRKLAYFGMDTKKNITQMSGTNAKLIEFSAIMGILNLKHFNEATLRRKELYELYVKQLTINSKIKFQKIIDRINYSYMPIILKSKEYKIRLLEILNKNDIFPREYFYPSLETIFKNEIQCDIAYDISNRVLCLPMSDYLSNDDVYRICDVINNYR